jgi:hypothetical protein
MADYDVSPIHAALDEAERLFHELFDGLVPGHADRFTPHLNTVRMIADLSAQEAPKEEAA